jgi:hypothetical protein
LIVRWELFVAAQTRFATPSPFAELEMMRSLESGEEMPFGSCLEI